MDNVKCSQYPPSLTDGSLLILRKSAADFQKVEIENQRRRDEKNKYRERGKKCTAIHQSAASCCSKIHFQIWATGLRVDLLLISMPVETARFISEPPIWANIALNWFVHFGPFLPVDKIHNGKWVSRAEERRASEREKKLCHKAAVGRANRLNKNPMFDRLGRQKKAREERKVLCKRLYPCCRLRFNDG